MKLGFILLFYHKICCYANVVSVWYRPIGERKQQDKMTTAQIYSNNNNQFQRCVYKAYIKWLGIVASWLRRATSS